MNLFFKITNNIKYILLTYLISILLASTLFSVIENHSIIDSLYWASITSLTIGYGDLSPNTNLGKILSIVFGHFWIFFIIPSVISHILANLIKNRNEFTHEEQEEIKSTLSKIEICLKNDK